MIRKIILLILIPATVAAQTIDARRSQDRVFESLLDSCVKEFLRRNPAVSTYRGGAGLDPSLEEADSRLRDHSQSAIEREDIKLRARLKSFERINEKRLSPKSRIDREVVIAQIRFLLRLHGVRRYQQRALDTYTDEPFKAVDWQLQAMTQTGEKTYGAPQEWELLISRLEAIPRFLATARDQLIAGIKAGNTPDHRMLRRNGIDTTEADANYFEHTLPALAEERITGPQRELLLSRIRNASLRAARSYRELRDFVAVTFFDDLKAKGNGVKPKFRGDRFVMGEDEYNWALRNNLRVEKSAALLYEESWPIVQSTRDEMIRLAREIGDRRGMSLPQDGTLAARAVFDELSKDAPKSDAEMIEWYREAAFRLVGYARSTGLFDVPADYRLEVVQTPPPLRSSIDSAAYGPAPPLKKTGVGRFYVTPTGDDPAALRSHNRAALADLAAHEGFPGHDWHYKVMTQYRDEISPLRWLTPGAAEDSSSMWQDSLAAEGWSLYAEALMAEGQEAAPGGFYTPEERLYQLKGKLLRDLRVRIDIGIHTGRIKYDDAVDLFSEVVDFLPGSCRNQEALKNDAKRASCAGGERAIFRYSKWPTQAITYRLGKDSIFDARSEAARIAGKKFSLKAFHLLVMKQGRIPVAFSREELMRRIAAGN